MPLKVSDGIGAWITDFKKSDAPQFKGKTDKERRDMALAAYMSAKNEDVKSADRKPEVFTKPDGKRGVRMVPVDKQVVKSEEVTEDATFKVNIEGLPMMFISGMGTGDVKARLRAIVKQPNMIKDVERVTDAEVKKNFRLKAQGRDAEETNEEMKVDYGSDESIRIMKKITPGEKNEDMSGMSVKSGHKRSVAQGAGMTKKGVAAYRRRNPGSKLKTAVTTAPSKLKPGSKAAGRRKSFCARSKSWTSERGKAARRRWNC